MHLTTAKGRLFVIGGGEDREGERTILSKFIDLAGGDKAHIVVLTTATNSPDEYVEMYKKAFSGLGLDKLEFISVSTREDAMHDGTVKIIEKATGIFFTGGDQLHITSLMGGTTLQAAVFDAFEKNVVVAGTSAGAAMMGSGMIIGGNKELNPRMGSVEMTAGTGLISNCVVDTHFSKRGRHGRLITAVAHFPQHLGLGVDENTAMLINKTRIEVFGEGAVTVFDASQMTYSDIPYVKECEGIALANIRVTVLPNDYKFDLKTRTLVVPKKYIKGTDQASGKGGTASEVKKADNTGSRVNQ